MSIQYPENKSLYGVGICPRCSKPHYLVLATNEQVVPPPVVVVGCQCGTPPEQVKLFYAGAA